MKQILQSYRTGELWLAEVPVPACGRGGVLVRTRSSVVSAGTEGTLLAHEEFWDLYGDSVRRSALKAVWKLDNNRLVRFDPEQLPER